MNGPKVAARRSPAGVRWVTVCLLAFVLAGCDGEPTGIETLREMAYLTAHFGDEPAIQHPDTVSVGESFAVSLETYWPNTCAENAGSGVRASGLTATVTPYLRVPASGEAVTCAQSITDFTHTVILRFHRAGTATLVVRGNQHRGEVVTYQRTVVVEE